MSMVFDDYYYVYRDSLGFWSRCTNPKFIAEHTMCRAVLKKDCRNLKKYLKELNDDK